MNTPFPDGSTARSLVCGGLPIEIKDQLRELDTLAARSGKPVAAAAGTLLGGSVDHVRRTILSIILGRAEFTDSVPTSHVLFLASGSRHSRERAGRRRAGWERLAKKNLTISM